MRRERALTKSRKTAHEPLRAASTVAMSVVGELARSCEWTLTSFARSFGKTSSLVEFLILMVPTPGK
jgi:hypothetical protein